MSARGIIKKGWRRPLAVVGLFIAATWMILAIFAPWVAPAGPIQQSFERLAPPTGENLFGTDRLGRDILSRVIWGSRTSITPGVILITIGITFGGLVGAIAGYFGGIVDEILMRIGDLLFAFPTIILAMAVVAVLGPSLRNAVIAVALVRWPAYARVVRSLILSLKDAEYVNARRLLGAPPVTVLRAEILPNIAGPVVVLATLDLGRVILILSGLSFLGLGTPPPAPDWGRMVADGASVMQQWWVGTFPGLAIFSIVVAFNLLGDALRDALDPRLKKNVGTRAV